MLNALILIIGLAVLAALGFFVGGGYHFDGDYALIGALRTGDPPVPVGPAWLPEVARDITALGSMAVLNTVVFLVIVFFLFSRRFSAALFLVVAAVGGQLLNAGLKVAYARDRPNEIYRWVEINTPSFPSGHAAASTVIYLSFAVLLARISETTAQRAYIVFSGAFLSVLVGLSRVYLGVHYPTDVIAGWSLGVVWVELCWLAARAIDRRRLSGKADSA